MLQFLVTLHFQILNKFSTTNFHIDCDTLPYKYLLSLKQSYVTFNIQTTTKMDEGNKIFVNYFRQLIVSKRTKKKLKT